eukprot:m51a1_g4384 hypothetical protein (410) ;mRNA; r:340243-343940
MCSSSGVSGRMCAELDDLSGALLPLALFPQGYVPASSAHDAVAAAMGTAWTAQFACNARMAVHSFVAETQTVADAMRERGVTYDEACAIAYYSLDARSLCGSDEMNVYRALNAALAGRTHEGLAAWRDFSCHLAAGLRRLPAFSGTVFRGVDKPLTRLSPQYRPGNRVVWVTFTSCTTDRRVMVDFANGHSDGERGSWMSVSVREGRAIDGLTMCRGESEVLLLPNTAVFLEEVMSPAMKRAAGFAESLDVLVMSQVLVDSALCQGQPPVSENVEQDGHPETAALQAQFQQSGAYWNAPYEEHLFVVVSNSQPIVAAPSPPPSACRKAMEAACLSVRGNLVGAWECNEDALRMDPAFVAPAVLLTRLLLERRPSLLCSGSSDTLIKEREQRLRERDLAEVEQEIMQSSE